MTPPTLDQIKEAGDSVLAGVFMDDMVALMIAENPYRSLLGSIPAKAPTLRQRVRGVIWDLRYRVAHALYPFGWDDE